MKNRSSLTAVLLGVALLVGSCGGSPAAPRGEDGDAASEPAAQPSPSSTYGFADYDFNDVSRGACVGFLRLGTKSSVTLDIHRPKSGVGEFFYPNCLTAVRRDSLSVRITNNGMTSHNFIVDGDDIELVVQPGETGKVDVELGPGDEIGFQCTIHARFMFGAFFRNNVS